MGHTTLATVVDHVEPHKGDVTLFYDPDNLQSLCKDHHDSTKAREEHGGAEIGCDKDGIPLDAGHRWNVGGGDQISGGKRADIVCGPSREKNPEILSDGV